MTITQAFIPIGKLRMEYVNKEGLEIVSSITRRSGIKNTPSLLIVHTNGNPASSLKGEVGWLTNVTNTRAASWNEMIKEDDIIQAIPFGEVSYNCGKYSANLISYSIEMHEGGDFEKTKVTTIKRIVTLLRENYGVTDEAQIDAIVKPHREFTSTVCPRLIPASEWGKFIDAIKAEFSGKTEEVKVTVSFSKPLKVGSKGEDVKTLQRILNLDGANLSVDGDFGRLTEKEVKVFQGRYNVPPRVDGVVGANSQKVLTDLVNRAFNIKYVDAQTFAVIIPKNKIASLDMPLATGAIVAPKLYSIQNGSKFYANTKADLIFNGGLFDTGTGAPCHYYFCRGKRINYNAYSKYALIVDNNKKMKVVDSQKISNPYYGVSFSPMLYFEAQKNSVPVMDATGLSKAFLNARQPKHAFIDTDNYHIHVFVEGRNKLKGFYGRNSYEMAELCRVLAFEIDPATSKFSAGELDGGSSITARVMGIERTRTYSVTGAIPMAITYNMVK